MQNIPSKYGDCIPINRVEMNDPKICIIDMEYKPFAGELSFVSGNSSSIRPSECN